MALRSDSLFLDAYYSSATGNEGDTAQMVTLIIREQFATQYSIQLVRQISTSTTGKKKTETYSLGEQTIKDMSDPLLLAIESHYLQNIEAEGKKVFKQVEDLFYGGMHPNSVMGGAYGLMVVSNQPITDYFPDNVVLVGQTANAEPEPLVESEALPTEPQA